MARPMVAPLPRLGIAAGLGAAWGVLGYALLWGLTPIVVHRAFVITPWGTVLLLPARTVLAGIRLVEERVVGRPFELSESHGWIALAAAAVGAAVAVVAFLAARGAARRLRRTEAPA
jgi:hypothetical protein